MKNLWLFLLIPTFFACLQTKPATQPTVTQVQKQVYFEGKTNAELLAESIQNMDFGFIDQKMLTTKDKILIGSLEVYADSESDDFPVSHHIPLVTFVEDALTKKITGEGLHVVERDINILTRLYHEPDDKYLISISPDYQPEKILKEVGHLLDGRKDIPEDYVKSLINKLLLHSNPSNLPYVRYPFNGQDKLQNNSKIVSASHIVSFRVLECGIMYRPVKDYKGEYKDPIERVALTKLHVRLTNQKGVIFWSDIVTGEENEIVPKSALPYIQKPNYVFSDFTTPVKVYEKNNPKPQTVPPNGTPPTKPPTNVTPPTTGGPSFLPNILPFLKPKK